MNKIFKLDLETASASSSVAHVALVIIHGNAIVVVLFATGVVRE